MFFNTRTVFRILSHYSFLSLFELMNNFNYLHETYIEEDERVKKNDTRIVEMANQTILLRLPLTPNQQDIMA
jgi:hypothetical protein